MSKRRLHVTLGLTLAIALLAAAGSQAAVVVQCPGDNDGDADWDKGGETQPVGTKCMHVSAGDGYATMADGRTLYVFSYADMTGIAPKHVMRKGTLAHMTPAPKIMLDEGDDFYLSLTNVGMLIRPDLFDPHTIHWHGFPEASTVFDGVPDASISINMGATLTYFYHVVRPGTYAWHCHVEATEHMQMGMMGNLYVRPAQDGTVFEFPLGSGETYDKFVYNDGDGSTGYDTDYTIQMMSFDPDFHDASETVQPLPFALMEDTYPLLNGRGYPDTVNPDPLPTPDPLAPGGPSTQVESSLIVANQGDRILLRLSNLSITRYFTLATLGIPMQVVGKDARLLRGPTGANLFYQSNSITLGGGETAEVILDTSGIGPGTYFLYTTNLNYLRNDTEEEPFGGMMTEIRIN